MTQEILVKSGTPVVWADTTDYVNTASGFTRTHQIDLTSLASTKARQGAKADLGAVRADSYTVRVGIEMDVAPTAGATIPIYWSSSYSGTAGTGNDGGASGADEAYKDGEEQEWLNHVDTLIGILKLTADAATTVQVATISNRFHPPERYGMPIVQNLGGQAFEGDAVEMFIALIPNVPELQDAP